MIPLTTESEFKNKMSRGEKTARKIINASLKLFVKKGYHGTSISDISKAIRLTKGAIYSNFESKDKLLKQILEEYEKVYLDKVIGKTESSGGKAIDKMGTFLRCSLNFAAKNKDLCLCLTNLSTELFYSKKKYEKDIKKYYKKYQTFLAKLLEEGQKDGSFREDIDPNIFALNLIGACEGNLLQWNMNEAEHHGEDFARSYMKFFLMGLSKPNRLKP